MLQVRTRVDACPGVLQVHPAMDGGLARVRLPGGRLESAALVELVAVAVEHGDGALHLTSRANVQLRGLPVGADDPGLIAVAGQLAAAGLLPSASHERVRNIVASPWTGLLGGRLDVRPQLGELDAGLLADPTLAGLPGRFLFGLDDGRGDVAGLRPDACWLALAGDQGALLLDGDDTGVRVPASQAAGALLDVARAFLAARGSGEAAAWRVRDLPERGRELVAAATPNPIAVVPDRQTDPGRRPLGVVRQRDGREAVAVLVPLGRLDAAAAAAVARLVPRLVVTPWRELVLPDLPVGSGPAAAQRLQRLGLVTDPASAWVGVTACAGRPGCARALADVRADATNAVEAGRPGAGTLQPVHVSGCERRCGRPAGPHLGVVAEPEGYRLGGLSSLGPQRLAELLPVVRAGG